MNMIKSFIETYNAAIGSGAGADIFTFPCNGIIKQLQVSQDVGTATTLTVSLYSALGVLKKYIMQAVLSSGGESQAKVIVYQTPIRAEQSDYVKVVRSASTTTRIVLHWQPDFRKNIGLTL